MSLPLVPDLTPITIACPVVVTLTPGQLYKTSVTQSGALGLVDVYATALTATELSTDVQVVDAAGNNYTGTFNWSLCQLVRLVDIRQNEVHGQTNISFWRWDITGYVNNTVQDGAEVFPPPSPFAMSANEFQSKCNVDFSAFAGASFSVVNNVFESGAVVDVSALSGNLTISNSTFTSNSFISATGAGNVTIASCNFDRSNTNFTGSLTKSISAVSLSGQSSINITGSPQVGTVSISNSTLENGSVINSSAAATVDHADMTNGILNTAGFTASRINLENATSTLIANIVDATKVNYPNPLP